MIEMKELVGTLVYSAVGIVFFILAYWLLHLVLPFSVHKEISEDQNTALGIIIGMLMIAIAIVIHGAIAGGPAG